MDSNCDTVEKFLARMAFNIEQTILDTSSVFVECDHSLSRTASIFSSDSVFSSIREWLDSSPSNDGNGDKTTQYSDEFVRGMNFITKCDESMVTILRDKEDLRHHLRNPITDNSLPIHYRNIEKFRQMIDTLSQVGAKDVDYSSMTSEKILLNLQKQIEKLEELEEKSEEVLQSSLNIAADIEQISESD